MKATLIVIENDADHAEAKALVATLMASNNRRDTTRLAAQARLIEAYERSRWPRRAPSAAAVLTYLMEQHGLSRADLAPLLGTPSRVSEVLSGKRELSLTMVQRLREKFDVSADVLIPRSASARARKHFAA
jgi:HTH-type transcriptional regulator / antitoxin HigA